jgi:hypothetical protein
MLGAMVRIAQPQVVGTRFFVEKTRGRGQQFG